MLKLNRFGSLTAKQTQHRCVWSVCFHKKQTSVASRLSARLVPLFHVFIHGKRKGQAFPFSVAEAEGFAPLGFRLLGSYSLYALTIVKDNYNSFLPILPRYHACTANGKSNCRLVVLPYVLVFLSFARRLPARSNPSLYYQSPPKSKNFGGLWRRQRDSLRKTFVLLSRLCGKRPIQRSFGRLALKIFKLTIASRLPARSNPSFMSLYTKKGKDKAFPFSVAEAEGFEPPWA